MNKFSRDQTTRTLNIISIPNPWWFLLPIFMLKSVLGCWSDFAKPGLSHVWPARVSYPPLPDSRMHIKCHFLIESSCILSTGTKEKVWLNTKLREMWKSFWKALFQMSKRVKGILRVLGSTKPYLEEGKLQPHFFLFKVWNKHWWWDTLMKEIEIMNIAVIKWNEKHFPYIHIWGWRSSREVAPKIEKNISVFTRLHRGKHVRKYVALKWDERYFPCIFIWSWGSSILYSLKVTPIWEKMN